MHDSSPWKCLPVIAAGAVLVLLHGSVSVAAPVDGESPLTTVAAIRRLTPQEASRGLPVRLRGIISYHAISFRLMFLQDVTGGIYVEPTGLPPPLDKISAGTLVEVEGVTVPGEFAPYVAGRGGGPVSIRPLGAAKLPEPLHISKDQIADPRNHCSWIELWGVVRRCQTIPSAEEAKTKTVLTLGPANARLAVVIYGKAARDESLCDLVGAHVRLRGVYGSEFNERRQLLGMRLLVSSRDEILVDRAGQGSPFSLPVKAISSLMQFSADSDRAARAHVRGIVTLTSGRTGFYMQDDTAGLWITGDGFPELRPGDAVDAGGFPEPGAWNPVLEDAVVRKEGERPLPIAKSLSVSDAFQGQHCFQRVQMEGALVEISRNGIQPALVVEAGGRVFIAHVVNSAGQLPLELEEGSFLRLRGICVNETDPQAPPAPTPLNISQISRTATFKLLLGSPGDVIVLRPPPWWTIQRLAGVVAVLFTVLCAAALWVVSLRRKISAQTVVIRQRLEREAVYDERTRIARELHDTLEQEITGIGMHIDAATAILGQSPDTARRSLESARLLLDRSRTESRRTIWELRSTTLEQGGLVAAFEEQAKAARRDGGPTIELHVQGTPRRLSAKIETHLFRIGHEALTNAIKHGQARRISIQLGFDDEQVTVSVEDDGHGFEIPLNGAAAVGHFGLLGMRERAAKIQARFDLASKQGAGTRISAIVLAQTPQRPSP
ncbi:MAG TPA: sensor histidine kinase [Pirellulales bacterium]|nr:sensor histidine kinase [Pirellulales bacterium]